jgi:hypothetical protein
MRPIYITTDTDITLPVVLDYVFRDTFQLSLSANVVGGATWTYEYTHDDPFQDNVNWTQCPEVGEQTSSNIVGIETDYRAVRGRILDGDGTVVFSIIQHSITSESIAVLEPPPIVEMTWSDDQQVLWGDDQPVMWG